MPEVAGTIPPVKERPKVARRPTLAATAAMPRVAAEPSQGAIEKAEASATPPPEVETQPSAKTGKPGLSLLLRRSEAKTAPAAESPQVRTVPGPQMLSVKERPKVTRQSTILAPARSAAKPAAKATPALPVAASAPTSPKAPVHAREEKPAARWTSWLPIAVGIAISSMAPQLFGLAGHWNPWGQRILFPLVQLVGLHEIGMSDELTRTLPQLMLYLQFPLEGLLVASNLRRGMDPGRAFAPVPGLHFVCGLVLWIVALGVGPLI